MIVNSANLAALFRGFSSIFNAGVASLTGKQLYERFTTIVPSSAKGNDYGWVGKFPTMREWLGDRIIQNLKAFKYSIENKHWESTISVDRDDVEDDNVGVYSAIVQNFVQAVTAHPNKLVLDLFHGAFSTLCFDGQYMVDDDHPVGDSTKSNKGTAALNTTSYAAARTAMMSLVDDNGNSLSVMPDVFIVPPQLEKTAREIVAPQLAGGASNIYANSAEVVVVPELAGNPTEWFLLDSKKPLKPFIFQRRKELKLTSMTDDKDSNVFMKKEFLFGVDARYNVGYGLWQVLYGSTGTV